MLELKRAQLVLDRLGALYITIALQLAVGERRLHAVDCENLLRLNCLERANCSLGFLAKRRFDHLNVAVQRRVRLERVLQLLLGMRDLRGVDLRICSTKLVQRVRNRRRDRLIFLEHFYAATQLRKLVADDVELRFERTSKRPKIVDRVFVARFPKSSLEIAILSLYFLEAHFGRVELRF